MSLGAVVRFGARMVRKAGWAPLLVFALHVFISRGLNVYALYPSLDIPMHFLGGLAMAYFLARCFMALPPDIVAPRARHFVQAVIVISLTATVSVLWEFAEFVSDAGFGTSAQRGLEDTLLDMALGILGGASYVLTALLAARR